MSAFCDRTSWSTPRPGRTETPMMVCPRARRRAAALSTVDHEINHIESNEINTGISAVGGPLTHNGHMTSGVGGG
eukprot:767108-Hanusia_phi.AAC.6